MNIRARLLFSGILAVLVVASGAVVQHRLGVRPLRANPAATATTGAWFCPHGGLWRTWVVVGNPGEAPATVRTTTFSSRGVAGQETFELAPGDDRYVEVPTPAPGTGTMVEFFDAPVSAGWVSQDDDGVAAESCRASAGRTWYATDGDTSEGRESWVIVMNPFAEDAAFDVTLLTAESAPTRSGSLRGYVLEGRRAVAFKLNEILLGEGAIAAVVSVTLGAVSVAQVGSIEDVGIRAVTAVAQPADRWALPSALGARDAAVSVADPSDASAAFSVRQQTESEQRAIEALTEVSLRGQSVRTYDSASAPGPAGLVVDVTGEVPVAASRRTLGASGGVGATSGSAAVASAWVVPPSVPPEGSAMQRLVLQNPGRDDVSVHVRLFGEVDADAGTVDVPAGRTVAVGLDELTDGGPAWVLATSDSGTFVASSASVSSRGDAFAVAVGIPGHSGPVGV